MKSEPLLLKEIYLIPESQISAEMQNEDLLALATSANQIYFTPGTGFFTGEMNPSAAGSFWANEFMFSFPGTLEEITASKLKKARAAVLKTESGRNLFFYKNDFISNTPMKPVIQSNEKKTQVKFSLTTLHCL